MMRRKSSKYKKFGLVVEASFLFIALPAAMYVHTTQLGLAITLWMATLYAIVNLSRYKDFSWEKAWQGKTWPLKARQFALLRFIIATPLIVALTFYLAPDRLFVFPTQHTILWLIVMVLYPLLSTMPQEILFRTFFFHRYQKLFSGAPALIVINALGFGFVHIVFHNWVAPVLSILGGLSFAYSYNQHKSLKWVVIEHAAYGCMIFTIGLGFYFVNGYRG
jgi:uncharacterized protein